MELGKRHTRSTFTPHSDKKTKFDSSLTFTRVYYSSSFDLFNFSDSMFLRTLTQRFPNCYLIVGIENDDSNYVMSLSEREEAIKRCTVVRQILCPAPTVDYMFLSAFQIDYLCTTPDQCKKFTALDLGPGLVILDPPVKLTSNDLIGRVISHSDQFLNSCFDSGYSRKQLDVSLLKELSLKLIWFTQVANWAALKSDLIRSLMKAGRKMCKRARKKVDYIENAIKDAMIGDILDD
jgi:glycerol-3-phosphate cytidylyltransferase-like family protein